jgi:hypothetical protein
MLARCWQAPYVGYDEPIMELSTRRCHNQLLGHESADITTACALDLYHRQHGSSALRRDEQVCSAVSLAEAQRAGTVRWRLPRGGAGSPPPSDSPRLTMVAAVRRRSASSTIPRPRRACRGRYAAWTAPRSLDSINRKVKQERPAHPNLGT